MTWLGVWLIGLGLADLTRAGGRPRAVPSAIVVGVVTVAVLAVAAGLTAPVDVVVLAVALACLGLWVRLSTQAMTTGTGHLPALAVLAGGASILVALSGWASTVDGPLVDWLAWADLPLVEPAPSPAHVLVVVGVLLVNLATANVIVRLVLVSVGAMRPHQPLDLGAEPQPSDQLRGGRLLGPMERTLIIGLGLAGQLTAAGLVIAAKGLIRFPELQAKRDEQTTIDAVGIDAVTEYFLLGSFLSWLLALGSLALTR